MPKETPRIDIDYPDDAAAGALWAADIALAFTKAEAFLEAVKWFCNRGCHDLRFQAKRDDDRGFEYGPEGEKIYSGELHIQHPCYGILEVGTAEEREKGLFRWPETDDDDKPMYTRVGRGYSTGMLFEDKQPWVPATQSGPHRYKHESMMVHPAQMAWEVINRRLKIGECSNIYIINGRDREAAAFFFPFDWGEQKDVYIIQFYNCGWQMMLFQGDPEQWAKYNKRRPRNEETDEYFATDHRRELDSEWGPHTAPVCLPIDRMDDNWQEFQEPRTFTLPEYQEVANRLRSLEYREGLSFLRA